MSKPLEDILPLRGNGDLSTISHRRIPGEVSGDSNTGVPTEQSSIHVQVSALFPPSPLRTLRPCCCSPSQVWTWGRGEYGRLGVGDRSGSSKLKAKRVGGALEGLRVAQVWQHQGDGGAPACTHLIDRQVGSPECRPWVPSTLSPFPCMHPFPPLRWPLGGPTPWPSQTAGASLSGAGRALAASVSGTCHRTSTSRSSASCQVRVSFQS